MTEHWDHESLLRYARETGQRVEDLLALSIKNDPFYAGQANRLRWARWFAGEYGLWVAAHPGLTPHLRRIHYWLVSQPEPRFLPVMLAGPDKGKRLPYENSIKCWNYLINASRDARLNSLIPRDGLEDHRTPPPRLYVHARVGAVRTLVTRRPGVWVEPLFAEAKDWHGLRRFRLRRLWRVNAEALLIAAGQNLKRLLSWRGWGRRPWPGGAPGLHLGRATPPDPRVLPVYWLVMWPLEQGIPPALPLASRTSVRAA